MASEVWQPEPIGLGAGYWREQRVWESVGGGADVHANFEKESQDFERQPLGRPQFVASSEKLMCMRSDNTYEQIRPFVWCLIKFVYACAVCVCVVPVLVFVVFFWWPAVPVQCVCVCVCMRGTWSALLLAGARVGVAAVGWEGEHPWALKPTSFGFTVAACCVHFCFYLKAPSHRP